MRAAPATCSLPFCILLGIFVVGVGGCEQESTPPPATPATQPATRPVEPESTPTTQAAEDPPPQTYLDVYREDHPDFPTTRPLEFSLPVNEAATLQIEHNVLLDKLGYLWVVHEEGQTPEQLAGRPLEGQSFVVDRPIAFTWWKRGHD